MNEQLLQVSFSNTGLGASNPVVYVLLFVVLALVPFALLALTSFLKLSVVFGILRNAIGAQQVPSSAIISLLSLILSIQIMAPVAADVKSRVENEMKKESQRPAFTLAQLFHYGEVAAEPVARFLERHSRPRERAFFAGLSRTSSPLVADVSKGAAVTCVAGEEKSGKVTETCKPAGETFFTLVSAFLLSELQQAFAIGFSIFLPFLVVDLVTANLLVGLGMMMVSPVTVSLPFKLILFVLCDGWFLLSRGLVLSYQ